MSIDYVYAQAGTPKLCWDITPGDKVRLLIPARFGGGAIEGTYGSKSLILNGTTTTSNGVSYDMLELLAYWNSTALRSMVVKSGFATLGDIARRPADAPSNQDYDITGNPLENPPVEPESITEVMARIGVRFAFGGTGSDQQDKLEYQLRITPSTSTLTYEECDYYSGAVVSEEPLSFIPDLEEDTRTVTDRDIKGVYPVPTGNDKVNNSQVISPREQEQVMREISAYKAHLDEQALNNEGVRRVDPDDPWGNYL
jgi:hypothetical protein